MNFPTASSGVSLYNVTYFRLKSWRISAGDEAVSKVRYLSQFCMCHVIRGHNLHLTSVFYKYKHISSRPTHASTEFMLNEVKCSCMN